MNVFSMNVFSISIYTMNVFILRLNKHLGSEYHALETF